MAKPDPIAASGHDWLDRENWGVTLGALHVQIARTPEDFQSVQALRSARFRAAHGGHDWDAHDAQSVHLFVRQASCDTAIATARLRRVQGYCDVRSSYCARFYDLDALARSALCCLEIGRVCIDVAHAEDPDILRALLAGLARLAQQAQADILMGCASFPGADPAPHRMALAYLRAHHLGPALWRPGRASEQVIALPETFAGLQRDGLRALPRLLRLYLGLGGWVSDHAVADPDLDTLHVFVVVEVAAIPKARARVLQHLARI